MPFETSTKIRLVDLTGHLQILRNFLEIRMIICIVDFMQNKFLYNHSYFVRWSTLIARSRWESDLLLRINLCSGSLMVPGNDHQRYSGV